MKYTFIFIVCFICNSAFAQPDSLFIKEKEVPYQGPQWNQKSKASLYLSQVTFVNWNSGGVNSISGLLGFDTSANYADKYFSWDNNASLRFGVNKQHSEGLRKSDDLLELNSNIGYKPDVTSNWFYSAKLNFRTQLLDGFQYPDISKPISAFMAPGYLFFGGGMKYSKNIEEMSLYFSPITLKATFILDEALANSGAFGGTPAVYDNAGNLITKGERIRKEVGILITNSYEAEVTSNISVKNILSLYSDYINNFGNVDIDWRLDFDFKVNSFVKATFGSHLRYDDDVKTSVPTEVEGEFNETPARIQWKQFLGIGFAVDF